ncbi:hypothetical protein [Maricaulis sp.]|uniref:hypothetical protein n=1 Tax=Maricaulis sp. TaxID=1486257 RepID=UPI0026148113|nr:hypothetical protein [Maricaulis sp.]
MNELAWLIAGVGAGAVSILAIRQFFPGRVALNVLVAVVAMNTIYVGASLTEPIATILLETLVASLVIAAALLFYRMKSVWLASTVLVHGVIDGGHFLLDGNYIPDWYIWLCLGFDFPFAAGAFWLLRRQARSGG